MLPRLCSLRRYSAHGHAPLNSKITAGRGGRGASVDWLIRFCLTSALCELKLSHYFSLGPADGPTGRATHFFRLPPFAGRLSLTVDGQSEADHGLPMECQRASTRDHD